MIPNDLAEETTFLLLITGLAVMAAGLLHYRNVVHHHYSPLAALITICIIISLAFGSAIQLVLVLIPITRPFATSVPTALAAVALGISLLNWLIYGFHWVPDN